MRDVAMYFTTKKVKDKEVLNNSTFYKLLEDICKISKIIFSFINI